MNIVPKRTRGNSTFFGEEKMENIPSNKLILTTDDPSKVEDMDVESCCKPTSEPQDMQKLSTYLTAALNNRINICVVIRMSA
jgi:hypothetical protein